MTIEWWPLADALRLIDRRHRPRRQDRHRLLLARERLAG